MPLNEFCRTELLVGEEGIAKLHNSKVIVLDEPTSSLTAPEVEKLFKLTRLDRVFEIYP